MRNFASSEDAYVDMLGVVALGVTLIAMMIVMGARVAKEAPGGAA